MGTIILHTESKITYHKGALVIKPFVGKKDVRIMQQQLEKIDRNIDRQLEIERNEEKLEKEFIFSSEKLDEIIAVDSEVSVSGPAVKHLTEQVIPVYLIKHGEVKAKLEPLSGHGSAQVRISQELTPAGLPKKWFRKFVAKQFSTMRKPLHLKTRKLRDMIESIERIEEFRKVKSSLFSKNHSKNNNRNANQRPMSLNFDERTLLSSVLKCILSHQITLSGLLPMGNGYFGTLVDSFLIEAELKYVDLIYKKGGGWKTILLNQLEAIEKNKLRMKAFKAAVKYARLCKDERQIDLPGLLS